MNRKSQYDAIVKEVMAAIACADKGEYHPRLQPMMLRTTNLYASFMPRCPEELLPPERRKKAFVPSDVKQELVMDFDKPTEWNTGINRQN